MAVSKIPSKTASTEYANTDESLTDAPLEYKDQHCALL